MKKIIIFILFLTALHTLKGESFKCGELHYSINKFDKSAVDVMCSDYSVFSGYPSTRNYSKLTSVIIPSSVVHNNKTYRVVGIAEHAFEASTLSSIVIPHSVGRIASNAFNYCDSLKSIVVKRGNPVYDSRNNCNAIIETESNKLIVGCQSTIIPDGVKQVGCESFRGCGSLKSIVIPKGTKCIADKAFQDCSSLVSVVVMDGVETIGSNVFLGCESLTSLSLPNSVKIIGENILGLTALYANESNWKEGVLRVNNHVIRVKKSLSGDYVMPTTIRSVASCAFLGCSSITSITLSEHIVNIGSSTFSCCSALKNVYIPDGVKQIGSFAFMDCASLREIKLPKGISEIEEGCFMGCSSLASITFPVNLFSINKEAFLECSSLSQVKVPEYVKIIGVRAFCACSSLDVITLGKNIKRIGESAFYGTCFYNTASNWQDGVLYIDDYLIEAKRWIKGRYIIREGTRLIADDAFYACESLKSVSIPKSVKSIGEYAFWHCASMDTLIVPQTVIWVPKRVFSNEPMEVLF